MPQTFLALAAIGILSFLTLHQGRHAMRTQTEKVDIEVTTMATQVGIDRLNEMRRLAFDESTKTGRILSSSELSTLLPLPSDREHLFDSLQVRRDAHSTGPDVADDDLDDFDAVTNSVSRSTRLDTLRFSVDSVVGYVQDIGAGTSSTTPTRFKQVSVRVTALGIQPAVSVTLSQLYSCGSRCDW